MCLSAPSCKMCFRTEHCLPENGFPISCIDPSNLGAAANRQTSIPEVSISEFRSSVQHNRFGPQVNEFLIYVLTKTRGKRQSAHESWDGILCKGTSSFHISTLVNTWQRDVIFQ
uniref:Uncharacterized protein n=1 Tax=Caenorhabditis japonica TaxID=281687 RepID=A0A8R1EPA3_CAEJA